MRTDTSKRINDMRITAKEAEDRAKFFYKHLFGMNLIYPVVILDNDEMDRKLHEYQLQNMQMPKRHSDINGIFYRHAEEGVGKPSEATIYINENRCKDIDKFNGTLIHELIHCGLWWQGLEYDDGQPDFERKLREAGLYSNWSYDYSKEEKDHTYSKKEGDPAAMERYERLYQEWKGANK